MTTTMDAAERWQILRLHVGELQHEVAEITFRVNQDGRDAVNRSLFQQGQSKSGLAAASHADHHRMRGQIFGIIEQQAVAHFARHGLNLLAQVKSSQFFKSLHVAPLIIGKRIASALFFLYYNTT